MDDDKAIHQSGTAPLKKRTASSGPNAAVFDFRSAAVEMHQPVGIAGPTVVTADLVDAFHASDPGRGYSHVSPFLRIFGNASAAKDQSWWVAFQFQG
jgi:hypothetical protein